MPRMPLVTEKGLGVAEPVLPLGPVDPEVETGLDVAVEVAFPVSPLLVADDWPSAEPEFPDPATGPRVTRAAPPSPPEDSPTATDAPLLLPVVPRARSRLGSSTPMAAEMAPPPLPPSPASAATSVSLRAGPVSPATPLPSELAPELASLFAWPVDAPVPVWDATVVVVVWADAWVALAPPRKASRLASSAPATFSGPLDSPEPVPTTIAVLSRTLRTQAANPPRSPIESGRGHPQFSG